MMMAVQRRSSATSTSTRHRRCLGSSSTSARERLKVSGASSQPPETQRKEKKPVARPSRTTQLREEATAPFRTARVFLFSALAASAGLGLGTACIRSLASFLNAPNAAPLLDNLSDVGVDLIALVVCLYLRQRDVDARNKALERLEREETLGALPVTIGMEKKRQRKLKDLRSFARPVIIASTSSEDLALAVEEAAGNVKQLVERGVVLVPVLLVSSPSSAYAELADEWRDRVRKHASDDAENDMAMASRVLAIPSQIFAWREWFTTQMAQAQTSSSGSNTVDASTDKKCVYISLRLDGRVRASGKNRPSLVGLSMSLPSQNWKGMLDGFDGSVNPLQ